jgi:hypothetical protein
VNNLYTENYKTLLKWIKNNTKEKIFHVLVLKDLILLKCLCYLNEMQSLSEFQWHLCMNRKILLKIYMQPERTLNIIEIFFLTKHSNYWNNLEKVLKASYVLTTKHLKLIKIVEHCYKDNSTILLYWNRIDSPEINLHI